MLATTVPDPVMPVRGRVYEAPDPLTFATSTPVAVLPVNETSAGANPVTASLKVTSNTIGDAFVGSGWVAAWLIVTPGFWTSYAPMSAWPNARTNGAPR